MQHAPLTDYYLAPVRWVTDDPDARRPYWAATEAAYAWIDLRGEYDHEDSAGFMFSAVPHGASVPGGIFLGEHLSATVTPKARRLMASALGIGRLGAGSVLSNLTETLTDRADFDGEAMTAPLMPTRDGFVEINLDGHGCVFAKPLDRMPRHRDRVIERHQKNIDKTERVWGEEIAGKVAALTAYRMGIEYAYVLPPRLRKMRAQVPATQYSDDFDRTNADPLDGDWTKNSPNTESIKLVANDVRVNTDNGDASARYDFALSSADHDVSLRCTYTGHGAAYAAPCGRVDPSAETYYLAYQSVNKRRIWKMKAGNVTTLSNLNSGAGHPFMQRYAINGSSHELFIDEVSVRTATHTDVALDSNLSGGIGIDNPAYEWQAQGDDWLIDDYVAAAGGGRGLFNDSLIN